MQTNNISSIHKAVVRLMGNRFEISVVSEDALWADERIEEAIEEIMRIEKLLTTYSEDSQTNQININAGIAAVKVDKEVFDLIQRSIKISDITQGAFDITYGSIDKSLWNFDKNMTSLPDATTAKKLVRLINYRNVILNDVDCTVFLKEKGMRIGFGGIGKGYAAERAKFILKQSGVESGIVNAAGDLTAWGNQPDGNPWTIGIANPDAPQHAFSYLDITNMAIATSGNYEKFILIDGKKYSHTIDPKTGLPVTGIKSVTIISPNAEVADAMATPVMIMGIKVGLDMINQIHGLACIIIDDQDKIYTSANINIK
ncbi:FAD:protein FMN transferase [Ferruginibacter lapsinanis]|uniref:FAD:protein FMN transferase n=1 Tax=Ferruginibacter lapsinanis TaxID=563172 RepID=UPI001E5DA1B5|nr:FAD:protein FMN transferase [Ferruginibacter lapsinanis]UEG49913.1 FAD:protein FMN transferase [Ferruginibacter lapsinanis]